MMDLAHQVEEICIQLFERESSLLKKDIYILLLIQIGTYYFFKTIEKKCVGTKKFTTLNLQNSPARNNLFLDMKLANLSEKWDP